MTLWMKSTSNMKIGRASMCKMTKKICDRLHFFALHGLHLKHDDVVNKHALFHCNLMLPDELFERLTAYTNTRDSEATKWNPVTEQNEKNCCVPTCDGSCIRKPRLDMYSALYVYERRVGSFVTHV